MKPDRINIGSSIYRRIIISLLFISLVFFTLLASIIFNVNRNQTENTIQQFGARVSTIINRTLQESMLENDDTELVEIMVDLTKFSGVKQINIFNQEGLLQHSSSQGPNVTMDTLLVIPMNRFQEKMAGESSDAKNYCDIIKDKVQGRILSISTQILNEDRCTNNDCHVHSEDDSLLGVMEVQLSLSEIDKSRIDAEIKYFIMVSIFIFGMIIIMVSFAQRTIYEPMAQIIHASYEVAKGNLDIRIPIRKFKDSDMSHVGNALNDMLEKLEAANTKLRLWSKDLEEKVRLKTEEIKRTQNELIHIERMASLGKLSSSVAHEINNPLAGVLTYTKLVSRLLKKDDVDRTDMENIYRYLDMIESETMRCGNIVKGLLDFSRGEPSKMDVISINHVLKDTTSLMIHSFKVTQIELETSFNATPDTILGNPNQIKQLCIALLVNAIEAIGKDGKVVFSSRNSDDLTALNIVISDTGSGIREEDINRIYEPFFTRKKDGAASGLGLAVAYGIVQQHQGSIVVNSELSTGTVFTITLPLYKKKEE
ncbi:MAG: hypothetical protein HQ509_01715 [Candidatus Marinimicrobia bacterium]|nr:hypothetical protein [Candidatus Neomarinimicrobiota bacterium]